MLISERETSHFINHFKKVRFSVSLLYIDLITMNYLHVQNKIKAKLEFIQNIKEYKEL